MSGTLISSCAISSGVSRALRNSGMIPVTRPPAATTARATIAHQAAVAPAIDEPDAGLRQRAAKGFGGLGENRVGAGRRAAIDADVANLAHARKWRQGRAGVKRRRRNRNF
jgi:hypothetical protein